MGSVICQAAMSLFPVFATQKHSNFLLSSLSPSKVSIYCEPFVFCNSMQAVCGIEYRNQLPKIKLSFLERELNKGRSLLMFMKGTSTRVQRGWHDLCHFPPPQIAIRIVLEGP